MTVKINIWIFQGGGMCPRLPMPAGAHAIASQRIFDAQNIPARFARTTDHPSYKNILKVGLTHPSSKGRSLGSYHPPSKRWVKGISRPRSGPLPILHPRAGVRGWFVNDKLCSLLKTFLQRTCKYVSTAKTVQNSFTWLKHNSVNTNDRSSNTYTFCGVGCS